MSGNAGTSNSPNTNLGSGVGKDGGADFSGGKRDVSSGGSNTDGATGDSGADPNAVSNFGAEISALVNDDSFIQNLRSNFMEKVSDKKSFFRELLSCIFIKPIGVRKLDHASKAGISNREYQGFGADVVAYLKKSHPERYRKMEAQSPLYKRYKAVWPECSDAITEDILALGSKIETQKKVQEMLGRSVAPTSGQPVTK